MSAAILAFKKTTSNCEIKLKEDVKPRKQPSKYIKFSTAQVIIYKYLNCNRVETMEVECGKYSKEELAEKLGIIVCELEKVKAPYFYKRMANRINKPLINLYCSTKWLNQE